LGVLPVARDGIDCRSRAAKAGRVTDELLAETSEALGRISSLGAMSAVGLVKN
jgi:hypothetical protein